MSNTRTLVLSAFAALASTAAVAQVALAADDTSKEKCFGISAAGKNDCAATGNNSCAGTSKVNFDKGAWKYVPAGTCVKTEVILPDGTKRNGALSPINS